MCYKIDMEIKLTAVFQKFPEGYAAFVEELPGANTQGARLEEARANLKEAVEMDLQRLGRSEAVKPSLCDERSLAFDRQGHDRQAERLG